MTTFQDGPAKGKTLMLHRHARFLRVTESGGKFDALDQLEDEPRNDEKLYAYKIVGQAAMCHVRASKGRGGFYPIATFKFVEPQPLDSDMRTIGAWHDWCVRKASLK